MYTNFFALSELPFSIAPNPKYLFMSDRHQEALTHLSYGLGGANTLNSGSANHSAFGLESNGGFVMLTGEVGTGKTTVSRCLMEQLPENTQVAFILNPTLSSHELLATICDQLKIRYRKTGATLKTLTDKIFEKLLKNHEKEFNTLLIIDEAQHLQPEVLEQLRLLTNLETNTKKLLQVILIGQPELQQLLRRRDLRQLAQRITARYHLLPLNKAELALYIKHRLSVADCHRPLFSKSALSMIHRLSQGIPRLTNLLCHRALMDAYNSNQTLVSRKIVVNAAAQALGEEYLLKPWWQKPVFKVAIGISILLAVLISGYWLGQVPDKSDSTIKESTLPVIIAPENKKTEVDKSEVDKTEKVPVEEMKISPALSVQTSAPAPVFLAKDKASPESENTVNGTQQLVVDSQTKAEKVAKVKFNVAATKGVSDELLAKFQSAIEESETDSDDGIGQSDSYIANSSESGGTSHSKVRSLMDMPQWVQNGVPPLAFEQHIYATDGEGWVRINGKDRVEGEYITGDLVLTKILPQQVIMTYRGETFSLPALTNW